MKNRCISPLTFSVSVAVLLCIRRSRKGPHVHVMVHIGISVALWSVGQLIGWIVSQGNYGQMKVKSLNQQTTWHRLAMVMAHDWPWSWSHCVKMGSRFAILGDCAPLQTTHMLKFWILFPVFGIGKVESSNFTRLIIVGHSKYSLCMTIKHRSMLLVDGSVQLWSWSCFCRNGLGDITGCM